MEQTMDWKRLSIAMHKIQEFTRLSILRQSEQAMASAGQLELLARLALAERPLTALELSHFTQMPKPSISRIVGQLLKKGYIQRHQSEVDGRSHPLSITPAGREELNNSYQQFLLPALHLQEQMGEAAFDLFIEQLSKATTMLQQNPVK